MGVLARALPGELETLWRLTEPKPVYSWLRAPETGMTLVRGRIGGGGRAFNLGEMTLIRCAVALEGGAVGVAYVQGRDARHAELAAVFDALLQDHGRRREILGGVIAPLARAQRQRRRDARWLAEPTRVEFFTVQRRRKNP